MKLSDLRIGDAIRYQVPEGEICEGVIQELEGDQEFPIEIRSVKTGLLGLVRLSEVLDKVFIRPGWE